MKQTFSIILIVATILPSLFKTGILIDFKINQDYIAKVLCINKDKPKTGCNGKCHLSKQLKKVENQEKNQTPSSQKDQLEIVYFFQVCSLNLFSDNNFPSKKHNLDYKGNSKEYALIYDIFHPPKCRISSYIL